MNAPTRAGIAAQTARLERQLGITPSPRASLEQRIAVIEARQGPRATKTAPTTAAGLPDRSGEGERMDRQMGIVDRRTPIVEQKGNVMVMRAVKRDVARRQRAEQGIAPADDAFLAAFRAKYYGTEA